MSLNSKEMTTISSNDFASRPDMYLDMAENHDVCIKKGQKMFHIVYVPAAGEQPVLEPDDDLRNAITGEELLAGIYSDLETFFADKR